jgi:hypothetical protein
MYIYINKPKRVAWCRETFKKSSCFHNPSINHVILFFSFVCFFSQPIGNMNLNTSTLVWRMPAPTRRVKFRLLTCKKCLIFSEKLIIIKIYNSHKELKLGYMCYVLSGIQKVHIIRWYFKSKRPKNCLYNNVTNL